MAPAKKTTTKNTTNQNIPKDAFLTTAEGLQNLKNELEFLEGERRGQIAERLKEAISYGDLSENSEYAESKEEQAFNETEILETKRKIQNAFVVSEEHGSKINLGSNVKVENIKTGEKAEYKIVGTTEIDPFAGKISNKSELGRELIGKNKGDVFKISVQAGEFEYKVISVK